MKIFYLLLSLCFAFSASAQWTTNTAANLEIAALNAADLQTVATPDGKTWIAYYSGASVAGPYTLRAQLLDASGNKLLGPDGIAVCSQPSGSAIYVFTICLDASNNLVIGFQYQIAGVNTAAVIKVTQAGSLPWGATGVILTAGLSPYVATLSTGETVVAWNNNSPGTLYMQKLGEGGVPLWAAPVSVQVGTTNTTRGQIVPLPNGNFTLIIQRKGVGINTTLYAQRYNSEGTPQWAAPVQLSNLATSGARYYSVLSEADTTYIGYYAASGSRFKSYVQRINPDGTLPYGINGAVFSDYSTGTDPYQQTTNMAKTPGSPYLWAVCTYSNTGQSQYGIYVQKFDRTNGTRLLNNYGKEVFAIGTDLNKQEGTLNLIGDAPLFMYYDKDYKIYATRLDDAGNFVWTGNSVLLSATTATQSVPKGRFAFRPMINNKGVALWYENRGTEYRGYAQDITAGGATGVLPVKLGSFAAKKTGTAVALDWTTLTEVANTGFTVERSADGVRFVSIGFAATKAAGGNSSAPLFYSLTDAQPLEGLNHYRLKQTDANGKVEYSSVVAVAFSRGKGGLFVFPNPTKDKITLAFSLTVPKATLTIYNEAGQAVKQQSISNASSVSIDLRTLAAGKYVAEARAANEVYKNVFVKE